MKLEPTRAQTIGKLGVVVFGEPMTFQSQSQYDAFRARWYLSYMTPSLGGYDYAESLTKLIVEKLQRKLVGHEVVSLSPGQKALIRVPSRGDLRRVDSLDVRKWKVDVTALQGDGVDTVLVVAGTHPSLSDEVEFLNRLNDKGLLFAGGPRLTFGLCPRIGWQEGGAAGTFGLSNGVTAAVLYDTRTNSILASAPLWTKKENRELLDARQALPNPFTKEYSELVNQNSNAVLGVWTTPYELAEPTQDAVIGVMKQEFEAAAAVAIESLGL